MPHHSNPPSAPPPPQTPLFVPPWKAYYTLFDVENLRVGFACTGKGCSGGTWHGTGGFMEIEEQASWRRLVHVLVPRLHQMAFVIPRHARSCRVYPLTPYHVRYTPVSRPLHVYFNRCIRLLGTTVRCPTVSSVTQPLRNRYTSATPALTPVTFVTPIHVRYTRSIRSAVPSILGALFSFTQTLGIPHSAPSLPCPTTSLAVRAVTRRRSRLSCASYRRGTSSSPTRLPPTTAGSPAEITRLSPVGPPQPRCRTRWPAVEPQP